MLDKCSETIGIATKSSLPEVREAQKVFKKEKRSNIEAGNCSQLWEIVERFCKRSRQKMLKY